VSSPRHVATRVGGGGAEGSRGGGDAHDEARGHWQQRRRVLSSVMGDVRRRGCDRRRSRDARVDVRRGLLT